MYTVQTGRPIFIPFLQSNDSEGVGLTGNAGESVGCTTPQLSQDVVLLGGTSDLDASTILLGDVGGERTLSNRAVPIRHFFGRRATAKPWNYFGAPLPLPKGDFLSATVLNVGGEGSANNPGHLVLVGEPANSARRKVTINPANAYPFVMDLSTALDGSASELKEITTKKDDVRDMIVWGASSDLLALNVRVWGADDEELTGEWTPVWAIAGLASGQVASYHWPIPYFIPAGRRMRFAFRDTAEGAEANGHLYLHCTKLARQS